jgi:ubiquinone/menaquinone biosynthesis C-methylase UbiE
MNSQHEPTLESVRDYYGIVLQSSKDLKTTACCSADSPEPRIKNALKNIHDDVLTRFYGCGSPIPHSVKGLTALDLGSGSGRDCYLLSQLVGEGGKVIGIDMTDKQLSVAREHLDYHRQKFGYRTGNVDFRQGFIEDLESAGIKSNSVDLIVSNCVINLSPAKKRVFSEAFRVLKPGGEIYFSDVFASRRISEELRRDPVLLGECLSGAMYIEDFRRTMLELGCHDYRVVTKSKIQITDPEIEKKVGMIDFYSITIRAFKLDLEDRCEDYGQMAIYKGTIADTPHRFVLDDHHTFETGKPYAVCSNTADMLQKTRFAEHFQIVGDTKTHYGLFDCAPVTATVTADANVGACC